MSLRWIVTAAVLVYCAMLAERSVALCCSQTIEAMKTGTLPPAGTVRATLSR
jgi:hypothetical protein